MKTKSLSLLFAAGGICALGLTTACSSSTDGASSTTASALAAPVEVLTYQAPVGELTWLHAKVGAAAECVMHDVGGSVEKLGTNYADAAGWLTFGVKTVATAPVTELALDCTPEGGAVVARTVEIRSIPAGTTPVGNVQPPAAPRRQVPALEGDPMALEQDELVARGYPPRPDAASTSAQYAAWLRVVSQPSYTPLLDAVTAPKAHGGSGGAVLTSEHACGADNCPWSGAATNPIAGAYTLIDATWRIPEVSGEFNGSNQSDVAVQWVGIGNSPGLLQCGAQMNVQVTASGTETFYYGSWYENVGLGPSNAGAIVALSQSQYPTKPWDTMSAFSFVCTSTGVYSTTGTYGCNYIVNSTEGWNSGVRILPLGGKGMSCSSSSPSCVDAQAEWIVERTDASGQTGLSDFELAAFDGLYTTGPFANAPLVTMTNGSGKTLAQAAWASGDLFIGWVGFN